MARTDAWKSVCLISGLSHDPSTIFLVGGILRTASSTHNELSQSAGHTVQTSRWKSLSLSRRAFLTFGLLCAALAASCVTTGFYYEWRFITEPANPERAEFLIGVWICFVYSLPPASVGVAAAITFFRVLPRLSVMLLAPMMLGMLEASLALGFGK